MTTLGEFHARVALNANKGNSLNAVIPSTVALAADFLEKNYNFEYMKLTGSFTQSTATKALPTGFKRMVFLRQVLGSDYPYGYRYLKAVDPSQIFRKDGSAPTAYWISGGTLLNFDNVPPEALDYEWAYYARTTWPTDVEEEPWLVNNAAGLLLAQSMLFLAPVAREPDWFTTYGEMFKQCALVEGINEEELLYGNDQMEMSFG